LFVSEPVTAAAMQARLRDIAAMLGYGGVEIFPKQTRLLPGDDPSWINMPYYNGDETTRYAVLPDGSKLTVAQFVDLAVSSAVNASFFKGSGVGKKAKEPEAFPDGPPCLNILAQMGFPVGTIDNGLVAIGTYYKKSTPQWKEALEAANRTFIKEPATSADIVRITKSLEKKDYNYACSKHPLSQHCNKAKCQTRKFGVNGGAASFPTLGELRKLKVEPPMYFWDVTVDGNTETLQLSSDQVQNPREFKRRVWDVLDIAIPILKQNDWDNTLNEIKRNNFRVIDVPQDATTRGQVWELIEKFCTYNLATAQEEILMGRPWSDAGRTYFRLSDLIRFLASQQFKEYKVRELAAVLNESGTAEHGFWNIKGKGVNWWSVPDFAKQTEGLEVPGDLKNDKPLF
jgi:hypothetical protein